MLALSCSSRLSPIKSNMAVLMVPGETMLTRTGAISTARQRARFSTEPPTQLSADCPGVIFRAGEPLTRVIEASSARKGAPARTALA